MIQSNLATRKKGKERISFPCSFIKQQLLLENFLQNLQSLAQLALHRPILLLLAQHLSLSLVQQQAHLLKVQASPLAQQQAQELELPVPQTRHQTGPYLLVCQSTTPN